MIEFNGTRSSAVRVFVEHYPPRPLPKRRSESFTVPGRSGAVIVFEDGFDNVRQRYDIFVSAEGPGLAQIASEAARWLLVPGYCRLEDEYDRDTYRMAAFHGPTDLESVLNMYGRAQIEFDCDPRRFLKSGQLPVVLTAAAALSNPTGCEARPLISLAGSGAGALTVGDVTLSLEEVDGVTIDCEEEDCTRTIDGTVLNFNSGMSGRFPRLGAGVTQIGWIGDISAVTIVPRWWTP